MSLLYNEAIIGAAGQGGGYEIEQSLRFDGGSKLSRASAFGNANASWTLSFWFKRSRPLTTTDGDSQVLVWSEPGGGDSNTGTIQFFYDSRYTATKTNRILSVWSDTTEMYTPGVQRDFSAWYHLVIKSAATSGTSGTVTYYLNGVEQVSNTVAEAYMFGPNRQPNIGARASSAYFSGYMAEFHYVHGTTKNYTDFGEFDDNGVWRPIEYTGGSYGDNGFYLTFDPSASNGVGHDHSGNGNNWTASGFTTSGTGTDVMDDTPTNNFMTWNPIVPRSDQTYTWLGVLSEGNLKGTNSGVTYNAENFGTILLPSSGKYYWECTALANVSGEYRFGCVAASAKGSPDSNTGLVYRSSGVVYLNGSATTSESSWTTNDIISFAADIDGNTLKTYKNGTLEGTYTSFFQSGKQYSAYFFCDETVSSNKQWLLNAGQRDFEHTPPTGHVSVCTANLPAPSIKDGSKYFNTVIYQGASPSDKAVTGVGFQPDFTWIKARTQAYSHALYDAVRGATKELHSDTTDQEDTDTNGLKSFDSDGFTVGSDGEVGDPTGTRVAWNWLEGASQGFDIINGTGGTAVNHNLGVAPDFVIFKYRDTTSDWNVYHKDATSTSQRLKLNSTAGVESIAASWTINSTNFAYGGGSNTWIAYLFSEVEGYSKFGSYTGNGITDGPFVYCGFRPSFLLFKRTNAAEDWVITDSVRRTYNQMNGGLRPNGNYIEWSGDDVAFDFTANGFKIRAADVKTNGSGSTYIFMALAENPFGGSGVSPATAR